MATIDLSSLTDAQLSTMQTNLVAAHARSLNSEGYSIGSRSIKRASAKDILAQLNDVSAEISSRADDTGGTGIVEFGEPE